MFNLFNNCKTYLLLIVIAGLVCYCGLLKYQNLKLENQTLVLQSQIAAHDLALDTANQMRAQQERSLMLTEKDATEAQVESYKRRDIILNQVVSSQCDRANAWLLAQILGFHWHNNIP